MNLFRSLMEGDQMESSLDNNLAAFRLLIRTLKTYFESDVTIQLFPSSGTAPWPADPKLKQERVKGSHTEVQVYTYVSRMNDLGVYGDTYNELAYNGVEKIKQLVKSISSYVDPDILYDYEEDEIMYAIYLNIPYDQLDGKL